MVRTTTLVVVGTEKLVVPGTTPTPGGSGPWLLNEDGSYILDENGNKIPLE